MTSKVLDFQGKRQQAIEEKRRSFERIVFQNFLGAYAVIDQDGTIYPVTLVDVSKTGCLFQVPWNPKADKKFGEGTEVGMRMYFTSASYIPVSLEVKYGKEYVDEHGDTYMQYGCEFDQSFQSFEALKHFIEFLYKFAEHSVVDRGEVKTYFY